MRAPAFKTQGPPSSVRGSVWVTSCRFCSGQAGGGPQWLSPSPSCPAPQHTSGRGGGARSSASPRLHRPLLAAQPLWLPGQTGPGTPAGPAPLTPPRGTLPGRAGGSGLTCSRSRQHPSHTVVGTCHPWMRTPRDLHPGHTGPLCRPPGPGEARPLRHRLPTQVCAQANAATMTALCSVTQPATPETRSQGAGCGFANPKLAADSSMCKAATGHSQGPAPGRTEGGPGAAEGPSGTGRPLGVIGNQCPQR